MLRGLIHVLAWSLATGAAVTLSWWGVHTVMVATAYEAPRALPVTAADEADERPEPQVTPTVPESSEPPRSSAPAPPSEPPAASGSTPPATGPATSPAAPSTPATTPPPASGTVRSYDTEAGRAVFDIGAASATLVTAKPNAGWSMQVWTLDTWIRVEFSSGAERVSVFCTWHDGPPRVEVGTY
ncbi:hypothetical protein AB0O01_26650 [Streptomyces sp. NPDC093252]|uniref:hypothetical protein n=1 Tax=Streptomyces sp. NPDC093252 TaxID=3154980 RepID=UPI0034129AF3